VRLLVERLWPRGLGRHQARIDHWLKDLAPSAELRRWYGHRPERWPEFRRKYLRELREARLSGEIDGLIDLCLNQPVTFVYASREEARNSAAVLRNHVLDLIKHREAHR